MNTLEILGATGDVTLSWDPDDVEAVNRARDEYERLRAAGYLLFTVRRATEAFDPAVGELEVAIIAAPEVTAADHPAPAAVAEKPRRRRLVGRGERAEQSAEFDPTAPRTVARPPMLGG